MPSSRTAEQTRNCTVVPVRAGAAVSAVLEGGSPRQYLNSRGRHQGVAMTVPLARHDPDAVVDIRYRPCRSLSTAVGSSPAMVTLDQSTIWRRRRHWGLNVIRLLGVLSNRRLVQSAACVVIQPSLRPTLDKMPETWYNLTRYYIEYRILCGPFSALLSHWPAPGRRLAATRYRSVLSQSTSKSTQ